MRTAQERQRIFGRWWYASGIRFQLTATPNDWALPISVDWGAYPTTGDDSKYLEYRWLGISVGPFGLDAFKDYDLWEQSKANSEQGAADR